MPVTSDAGYIHSEHSQILEIFPYLFVTFLVAYPVKLGVTDVMIVIQHKAQIIGKVCCIDQQMGFVFALDRYFRRLRQIVPEQSLDAALR